jgi:hypothetical protein
MFVYGWWVCGQGALRRAERTEGYGWVAVRQLTRSLDAGDKLDELNAHIGEAHLVQLRTILEAQSSGAWLDDGLDGFPLWVALRCDVTVYKARRMIAAARKLDQLPLIADALGSGSLGLDKVLELSRFVTPEKQRRWIHKAQGMSVGKIKEFADEANAAPVEDARTAERCRYLGAKYSMDGLSMSLFASLPALEGALVMATIDEIADKLQATPEDEEAVVDPVADTLEMRRADALVELVIGSSEGAYDDDALCDIAPTLVVHADVEALVGNEKGGAIEDGPVLHPAVVQQVSCDPRLQVVLERNGTAVGIGYEARAIPRWLARQLKRRDRCCRFPGCNRKTWLQGHHVTPWPAGPTELTNLVCLCWRHHKLIHLFGWRVTLSADDPATVTWYRPNGRRFDPGPVPGG